jgi:Rsm1-like
MIRLYQTQSQVNALCSAVSLYISSTSNPETSSMVEDQQPDVTQTQTSSQNATLASLFGWALVPSNSPEPFRRVSTTFTNSSVPSPPPPPLSRASSVPLIQASPRIDRHSPSFRLCIPSNLLEKPDSALLHCGLCQRRIGLWAFTIRTPEITDVDPATQIQTNGIETLVRPKKPLPQRSFDLLKEHRSYCPYVVRSTFVPSLPVPQSVDAASRQAGSIGNIPNTSLSHQNGVPGALEGWRAILTVVLRYGMAQRQRIEYNFLAQGHPPLDKSDEQTSMDVDVKAMVAGVKSRGVSPNLIFATFHSLMCLGEGSA